MKYYNRDLSWLGFNERVLKEADDASVPLYERLKFLSIFSSNMDEFFRVRYPSIISLQKLDKKLLKKEGVPGTQDVLSEVHDIVKLHSNEFGRILNEDLLPELEKNNIMFYYNKPIQPEHKNEMKEIFLSKVLSFIQPVFLDAGKSRHFMPENGKLYFVVTLRDNDRDSTNHVMVNIPSHKLKRFYVLEEKDNKQQVVFIDDIIRENLSMLFPGLEIQNVHAVKFNRDAELIKRDDYSANVLDKIEKTLSTREEGAPTRFLYEKDMPVNLQLYLAETFGINLSDMFAGGRYHNLSDLFNFPSFDPSLHNKKQKPILFPASTANGDIFNAVSEKDILLHIPYHSYTPVLSFFNQAAVDIDVTDIYITLYRVAAESHIVNALISAAKNGKNVTAFIELKARFDEANNIKWSRVMKKAGIKLVYSDPEIKVHSKIALVTKKRKGNTQHYAVISTGNFNESTAAFYTDHVLFTVDKKICKDLIKLFKFLKLPDYKTQENKIRFNNLLVAQFNINDKFKSYIDAEIDKVKAGGKGLIRIKVNNLEEPDFIDMLYAASKQGVQIRLLVRSICCLIPQREGLSMTIHVRRLVDKYLEHSRLFLFGEGENCKVIMGSSDLMTRNLKNRIEVCVPLKDKDCAGEIIDYFEIQWSDSSKLVELDSNLDNRTIPTNVSGIRAQEKIYAYLKEHAAHA